MKHSYNAHGRCVHCDCRRGSIASQQPCEGAERSDVQ